MIPTKIHFEKNRCKKCHKPFLGGDEIMRTNDDYAPICLCVKCAKETRPAPPYISYVMEGSEGKLILNRASYQELENNIYEIKHINNRLIIDAILSTTEFTQQMFLNLDTYRYLLEKKQEDVILLFSPKNYLHKFDFCDKYKDFQSIIEHFEHFTGRQRVTLACNQKEQVVGISNLLNRSLHRTCFDWKHNITVSLTYSEIEGQYISNNPLRYRQKMLEKLTPQTMLQYCENRIQGQGTQLKIAVYQVYKYMANVLSGTEFTAPSWVLTAPSGSGKTEFFRAIRDLFKMYNVPIPVVQIDLSQITETGFKGDNISTIPQAILQKYPSSKGVGICFLDEADKKCMPSYDGKRVNVNAAIQSNLLTLIEGREMKVEVDGDSHSFDSNLTMFVLMGAFQDIRNKKGKEPDEDTLTDYYGSSGNSITKHRPIGFTAGFDISQGEGSMHKSSFDNRSTLQTTQTACDIYADLTVEDLMECGMLDELAGRMEQIVNFRRLSEEAMRKLLHSKTIEISKEQDIEIELSEVALEKFLEISFSGLGIRRPMNLIRALAQNTIADAFFDGAFDPLKDKIIIDSVSSAHIERPHSVRSHLHAFHFPTQTYTPE